MALLRRPLKLRTLADIRERGRDITTSGGTVVGLFFVHATIGRRRSRFLMIGHEGDPGSVIEWQTPDHA